MASQSLPILCPACGGHDLKPHNEVAQCHDCGHVIEPATTAGGVVMTRDQELERESRMRDVMRYWNLWRAKYGSSASPVKERPGFHFKTGSDNDFWFHWEAAFESGDFSIFADFEEESEPEEEPQQEKRWGDPGFWDDFGRQYREAEDREQGRRRTNTSGINATSVSALRTLGVKPDATREEIRSAYRALALKHHPDHGGSVERMREINLAYAAIVE